MPDHTTDDLLRRVLTETRVIALVGWSPKPDRPSHRVAAFLHRRGYRVIPVNPGAGPDAILGQKVYPSLAAIDRQVDMVDVFRRSQFLYAIAEQSIAVGAKVLWAQIGVRDDVAARLAENAGLTVVMDRCPKIEYMRLLGR